MDGSQGDDSDGDPFENEYIYNIPRKPLETVTKEQAAGLIHTRDTWPWQDDDVIVATFPRSGTHICWVIARYVLQGSTEPILDPMENSLWFTFGMRDLQKGRRRVIASHFHAVDFPKGFWKTGKRKCFVVVRNMKDVAWSYYNTMKNLSTVVPDPGTWDEFLPKFCSGDTFHGSWFKSIRAWEEFMDYHPELPITTLYFEDMVMDLRGTVRKIANFLERPIPESLVDEIARKCEFKEMKQLPLSESFTQFFLDHCSTTDDIMYRKGQIGDWKNHFTVSQNELIEAAYREKMKGSKRRFLYE